MPTISNHHRALLAKALGSQGAANDVADVLAAIDSVAAADATFLSALNTAAPQTALTAANAGVVNSGDGTTDDVIEANRTRIGEIETKLVALGLLTAAE